MIDADFTYESEKFNLRFTVKDDGPILLTGENGSGKTTSLLCIAGFLQIKSGRIALNATEIQNMAPIQRRVVYINHSSYFESLTGRRHIDIANRRKGDLTERLIRDFGVSENLKVREMSQGNRMRVSIAAAIASRPRAILLDEVISFLSDLDAILERVMQFSTEIGFDLIVVAQGDDKKIPGFHHYGITNGKTVRRS